MSSTASSSDSDDSRRRRRPGPGPPPPPPPQPFHGNQSSSKKKKKKKKYIAPQDTIDKLWSRFSVSKFSKATKVLPNAAPFARGTSAKTVIVPQPGPQNQLVSEDFERAVKECRVKVKKLIKECRRVNMRYRDPSFDIDWDLKWEKGNCLNTLGETRFEVLQTCSYKSCILLAKGREKNVKQGSLGNCWLMASLTALANMEDGIQRICVEWDTNGEWIISIIDDKLYLKSPDWDSPSVHRHLLEQSDREDVEKEYRKTYQTGSQALFFAQCKDPNQTWLPLLEKAYAKAHGDFHSLSGGWIGEGVEDLTGGVTTELLTSDILDTDEFWHNEILKVNKEFLFGCSTGHLDAGYGSRDGISESHAYVIMEARELSTGERLLKLRNPWGKIKKGNWEGPWSDGSKEFTPEAQIELNHKFGNDSVFWISYQDLLRKYQHFERTRLFMDSPDWRLTQEWISVEVPWRSEFEQKFMIILKNESPIVLVMSQLDYRYFEGLQGQYTFRLQFRLHEASSPDEEDYTSSRRNIYTVFLMVIAERNKGLLSVEEVVRDELRRKEDNEKLAQVGTAYDLAHNKGLDQMKARIQFRKTRDKVKARESRIAQRKNSEKREGRQAKHAEDAKKEKESKPKDRSVQTEDITKAKVERQDKSIQTEDPLNESTSNVVDTQALNERDKSTTPVTPKSNGSSPHSQYTMVSGRHRGPPPPPSGYHRRDSINPSNFGRGPPAPRPGPYRDDDPTLKPRNQSNEPKPPKEKDEEDDEAEPWNAVCIVGFRVYSKDEGLVLKMVMWKMLGMEDDAGDEDDAGMKMMLGMKIMPRRRGRTGKDGKLKDATITNDSIPSVESKTEPEENLKTIVSSDSSEMVIASAAKTSLLADDTAKEPSL
ncbi:hypothetical protein DID88_003606 [Monilinia fructigena]|uniref:Calpain catalytic domain-containing protein n=1 Tax=Monilinia fructigena TaxID=38457 RepID=A0A395ITH0_9HELO|nr:hypothetical protein DID88_003606 [Monilinia fructigena]